MTKNTTTMTAYVGNVFTLSDGAKRIAPIFTNKEHNLVSVPHVEMLNDGGLTLIPLNIRNVGKFFKTVADCETRYLTQYEVDCFMNGVDTDGNRIKTPAEEQEESRKWLEALKTTNPELYEKLSKTQH